MVVQDAIPDVASVPDQLIGSGEVYQPLASAGREGSAVTPTGATWSMRIGRVVAVIGPSSLLALHERCVPVVSAVSFTVSQPDDDVSPVTVH
jgi:hypothetical protein